MLSAKFFKSAVGKMNGEQLLREYEQYCIATKDTTAKWEYHSELRDELLARLAPQIVNPVVSRMADLELAAELLEEMYYKWENGDPCFSDSDDSLGNAFLLGDREDVIIDVLKRLGQ